MGKSKGVEADRKTLDSDRWPKEGNAVRSRLWSLILRELPYPLRWFAHEVINGLSWLDNTAARIAKGFRESPVWYFVTAVGALAVLMTIAMFISLINQTSGNRPQSLVSRSKTSFNRRELELIHDWTVQDHWRVAHLFVPEQSSPETQDIQLDSRLFASRTTASRNSHFQKGSDLASFDRHLKAGGNFDVRLDLSRPKKAEQDRRTIAGTVLNSNAELADQRAVSRIQKRDPRLLVQAAWDFGSDCNRGDSVSVLPRRPIPMPEPELPIVPARRIHPDLSFEMVMERHFTTAGKFPPGSHLVRHSDQSVFPENFHRFPSELVSHVEGPWKWRLFHPSSHIPISKVIPYERIGAFSHPERDESTSDEYDETLRAVADVALRIELIAPKSVSAGEATQTDLRIINEGPDAVSEIDVKEILSGFQTVIDASPEARFETVVEPNTGLHEKRWRRQFPELLPGAEQDLTLKWVPEGSRRLVQRARVIARAEISTYTEVSRPPEVQQMPSIPPEKIEFHPALACDIQYLDRVHVGDDVEMEVTVRNTGDVTLHDVKFEIEFPTQFSHSDGQSFVFNAGSLAVKGKRETVLRFSAVEAGEAVNLIRLTSAEQVQASGQNTILVSERRQEKKAITQTPEPLPNKPPNNWKLTNPETTQRPPSDAKSCCCQKLQVSRIEPVVQFP